MEGRMSIVEWVGFFSFFFSEVKVKFGSVF